MFAALLSIPYMSFKSKIVLLYYANTLFDIRHYKELLFEEFELEGSWALLEELSISYLNGFLCPAGVVCWVDGFNAYHYWVVIIFQRSQVFNSVK